MKTFLIILQLNSNENLYINLDRYLKTCPTWARPVPGVWIVRVSSNSVHLRDGIKTRINKSDKVLVMEITEQGWASLNIPPTVTDWIKNNLK